MKRRMKRRMERRMERRMRRRRGQKPTDIVIRAEHTGARQQQQHKA